MQETTDVRETVAELLLQLARLVRRHTYAAQEGALTPEQFWLLKRLWKCGPMRVSDLAAELRLTPASVTAACKRLERSGYVRRDRGLGGDERVVWVSLTDAGQEQLLHWQQARRIFLLRILSALSDEEVNQLLHPLERLVGFAEQEEKGRDASR